MARPKKYKTPEEAYAAKLESNRARQATQLLRIEVQPYRAEGEQIKAAAKTAGTSTQAYILDAVRQRIAADQAGGYLIYMSSTAAAANAEKHGQTAAEWAADHSRPKTDSK